MSKASCTNGGLAPRSPQPAVHVLRLAALLVLAAIVVVAAPSSASAHTVPKAKWLPAAAIEFLFDRPVAIGNGRAVSAPQCVAFGPSVRYKLDPSVRAFKHFRCKSVLVRKSSTGLYKRIGTATFELHVIATKQKFLLDAIKLKLA